MCDETFCVVCNKLLTNKQKKFCSKSCKNADYQNRVRKEYKEKTGMSLQSKKGVELKLMLINEMGGCCMKCGYDKNISALEFHHIDSSNKVFTLDTRNLSNRNIKIIRNELSKCVLLCSNCHQETHNPHLNIENLK